MEHCVAILDYAVPSGMAMLCTPAVPSQCPTRGLAGCAALPPTVPASVGWASAISGGGCGGAGHRAALLLLPLLLLLLLLL